MWETLHYVLKVASIEIVYANKHAVSEISINFRTRVRNNTMLKFSNVSFKFYLQLLSINFWDWFHISA
jgi:hypothetical protein